MVSWLVLWLAAEHIGRSSVDGEVGQDGGLEDREIRQFLLEGTNAGLTLAERVLRLPKFGMQMMNLLPDWICIYLPRILQKISRVTHGVKTDPQVEHAFAWQLGMLLSRAKLAIPFIGKDVPPPSSEFAHPDVTIGLALLSLCYEACETLALRLFLDSL